MQEYDETNIYDGLNSLCSISNEISTLLLNKNNLDTSKILNKLYSDKKQIIEKIFFFTNSEIGLKFIDNDADNWNKKIKECIDIEELNVEKLKSITNDTGNKLKDLIKNKSILVYSKVEKS